ncbi:MAG: hydantoinase/oxoprolinase family protein, partial [Burkholderiaceae bacterium]
KVGLLTTRGFRDSLEARRGLRTNPWDHRTPYPPVLVPRYLRQPVSGRIDADGSESIALSLADVETAAEVFRHENVSAVAICLLNSFINPAHELAAAKFLSTTAGFEYVSVSSEVAPVIGEYERTSTTVINACLMPRVATYLNEMERELIDMGLRTRLLILQSNGGAASLKQLRNRPVSLLLSGPSAGVGALQHLAQASGRQNMLTMEIGGTSCDVMLMHGGEVAVTDQLSIDDYDLVTPSVDIHTVGAGGGTIAGMDKAGMLFAGPAGAGARPGPAAYGHGGTEPTVTDAQLILGRLRPGPYAGGSVSLDLDAATAALNNRIAKPAGISLAQAAAGIIQLVEQNLLHAVERISMQRGYNPRDLALVACGGAGPMHGASVGRRLGTSTVYIPRQAGAFCAMGMQHADVRRDFVMELGQPLAGDVKLAIGRHAKSLHEQAGAALEEEGFAAADCRYALSLDMHYTGQQWSVQIDASADDDLEQLQQAFEAEYDRLFGHTNPGNPIIVARVRLAATGSIPKLAVLRSELCTTSPTHEHIRPVFSLAIGEFVDTPVYHGPDLQCGQRLTGPAIIEEATTTIVVDAGDEVAIDDLDNYVLTLAHSK